MPPQLCRITTPQQFQEALSVRYAVFCDEQKIPREVELDVADEVATHVLLCSPEGGPVATGRVLRQRADGTLVALTAPEEASDVARIGRMAVMLSGRRSGLGAQVLRELEQAASEAGLRMALLHAQVSAVPFYLACGYREQGERFMEENIPHVEMVKPLV